MQLQIELTESLERAFANVCENLLFMFVEPAFDAPPPTQEPLLEACILFRGALVGSISLRGPDSWCRLMAANALGLEAEEVNGDQAGDALKELSNVVCGQFLTDYSGADADYSLSIPVLIVHAPSEDLESWGGDGVMNFNVEGAFIQLCCRLGEESAAPAQDAATEFPV